VAGSKDHVATGAWLAYADNTEKDASICDHQLRNPSLTYLLFALFPTI
jgi:hypothetical protein